jgi:hypothetical protein
MSKTPNLVQRQTGPTIYAPMKLPPVVNVPKGNDPALPSQARAAAGPQHPARPGHDPGSRPRQPSGSSRQVIIHPSKPDTRAASPTLPAPSHTVNDVPPAYSTERPASERGSFVPVKVVSETALPAPGAHVTDPGRH